MIANERQYRIAKAELRRFREALETQEASHPRAGIDPRIHRAMSSSLASEAEVLANQVKRYEALRDGRINRRELHGLRDLPDALIEARIASGLTQKELALRLGLREQQIQRWEANRYAGVGVDRLQEVMDAVGIKIQEKVTYTVAT